MCVPNRYKIMGLIIQVSLVANAEAFLDSGKGHHVSTWITVPKTRPLTTTQSALHNQAPTTNGPHALNLCNNKIGNCADYGSPSYACQGTYAVWAREHCNQYCGYCVSVQIPTTRGSTTGLCRDKNDDCSKYGEPTYACAGQFEKWAKENCAKYCGYCHNTLLSPTTVLPMPTTGYAKVCEDKVKTCRDFGDVSYACHGQFEPWAKINCALYCGFCHGLPSPTTALPRPTTHAPIVCKDKVKNCQDYGSTSYACYGDYEPWSRQNCAKHCGFCGTLIRPTIKSCTALKADIQFLVDVSPSIGQFNFRRMKTFIYNFTNHFKIGTQNVQVGVTTYSDKIRSNFSMNQFPDKPELLGTISNLTYANIGVTHTGYAINYTMHSAFTNRYGDRPDVQNILITITDGVSSTNTTAAVIELRRSKINSFVVGVGNFSQPVLEEIASSKSNIIKLETIADIYKTSPFSSCVNNVQ